MLFLFPNAALGQADEGVSSCKGEDTGVVCATANSCMQGICLMEECLEAPKTEGADCSLADGSGAGVCMLGLGSPALICIPQVGSNPSLPYTEPPAEAGEDGTTENSLSPCYIFPENAECSLAASGEEPRTGSNADEQPTLTPLCQVRQNECALQLNCDSGLEVLMGTITGNTVLFVTAGASVTGSISTATGTVSFSNGRMCTPISVATRTDPLSTEAPAIQTSNAGMGGGSAIGMGAAKEDASKDPAQATTKAPDIAATMATMFTPPALGTVAWNQPRIPDALRNDVVITVSFLVQGETVPPLWQLSTHSRFPDVTTSPTGHDVVAALTEYVKRNTVYDDYAFDLVPIHPRGTVPPTVQVMKYSLVKHECRQSDRDALLQLLVDPARVRDALSIRSASLGGVEGISIIEVEETPVTKNVRTKPINPASKNNIILILVFTIVFLVVAGAVLYFYKRRVGSEDFHVLPLPTTSSTGGVAETTLTEKRAASLLFRSEAAPSADTFVISRLPFNLTKNRFQNHLPYDHTRIELNVSNGVPGSDYINASLIPGHQNASYIATQAPLANTVRDFWRMICEQRCTTVVMLTLAQEDGVEHSYQYWPHLEGDGNAITFGDITVTTIEINRSKDTAIRKIAVSIAPSPRHIDPKFGGQTFVLTHCLFMGFSKNSTPIDTKPFRLFRQTVVEASKGSSGATLVHCDNGSGRSGVYICFDMTLARYTDCGEADLFEAVVTVRKNRPQMIESKAQYLFLHRAFVDEMQSGSLRVLGQHPQKHIDFLQPFAVPALLAPFDIGTPGRKIIELGELQLVNARGGRYANATLAILSDLVVLCCEQDGQQVLQGYADRRSVAESLFDTVKGTDSLCFAVVLDQLYVLAAADAAIKSNWLQRLKKQDNYVAPGDLVGERITSFRPTSRSAALAILNCADPQTQSGSSALKIEFDTIPRVFRVGPRTIYKVGTQTAATTGVLRNPLGPNSVINPIAGAPGGDSSIFFGSPAMLSPNRSYNSSRPPAMMDLSIASAYGEFPSQKMALSMDGKVLFPELGRQAAAKTESLLANKVGELEAAILQAATLEHIASGEAGPIIRQELDERPGSVSDGTFIELDALAEPGYVYDDDEDEEGPAIRDADRDFNNAHRAALWQVFRDCEFATRAVDVEALSALMEEWGLITGVDGEDLLQATLKLVGPIIEVDNFEVAFLAQQRLRDGRIRRYNLADHQKKKSSPDADFPELSTTNMVRRASHSIRQDMTSTPNPQSSSRNVADEDSVAFSLSHAKRVTTSPQNQSFAIRKMKPSVKPTAITRQDLMLGHGSDVQMPDHHINEVLKKRGVSIPALALKSLHNERKKAGHTDVDDVFTIHGGAKKRMTRNPTMRAKKHYKERPSIQNCTFLANCTCPSCSA